MGDTEPPNNMLPKAKHARYIYIYIYSYSGVNLQELTIRFDNFIISYWWSPKNHQPDMTYNLKLKHKGFLKYD